VVEGGVGERRRQYGAEEVGEQPAPPVAERARLLVARVQTDLDGGRRAHHGPACGTRAVEIRLHRVVTRLAQEALRGVPGVRTDAGEAEVPGAESGAYGVQVRGDGVDALRQGGGRQGAEFELAAWLDGEGREQWQGPQSGHGRFEAGGSDGEFGEVELVDEPFEFDADGARWTCLETDTAQ
jgi:hypothetical protein